MPKVLTTNSSITCPHGGTATLSTANSKTSASGGSILLESDVHTVAGCSFTLPPPKPSPCIRIEWKAGAANVKVNGTAVLTEASVGLCYSPESAPQGAAIKSAAGPKASAT